MSQPPFPVRREEIAAYLAAKLPPRGMLAFAPLDPADREQLRQARKARQEGRRASDAVEPPPGTLSHRSAIVMDAPFDVDRDPRVVGAIQLARWQAPESEKRDRSVVVCLLQARRREARNAREAAKSASGDAQHDLDRRARVKEREAERLETLLTEGTLDGKKLRQIIPDYDAIVEAVFHQPTELPGGRRHSMHFRAATFIRALCVRDEPFSLVDADTRIPSASSSSCDSDEPFSLVDAGLVALHHGLLAPESLPLALDPAGAREFFRDRLRKLMKYYERKDAGLSSRYDPAGTGIQNGAAS